MSWPKLRFQASVTSFWARAWICQKQQKTRTSPAVSRVFLLAAAGRAAILWLPVSLPIIIVITSSPCALKRPNRARNGPDCQAKFVLFPLGKALWKYGLRRLAHVPQRWDRAWQARAKIRGSELKRPSNAKRPIGEARDRPPWARNCWTSAWQAKRRRLP